MHVGERENNLCVEEENVKTIVGERENNCASNVRESDTKNRSGSPEAGTSSEHGKDCTIASNTTSIDVKNKHDTAVVGVGLNKEESIKTYMRRRKLKTYEKERKNILESSENNLKSPKEKRSCSSVLVFQNSGSVGGNSVSYGVAKPASKSSDGVKNISTEHYSSEDASIVDLSKDYPERMNGAVMNDIRSFAAGANSAEICLSTLKDETHKDSSCMDQSNMNLEIGNLELSSGKVESGPSHASDRDSHYAETVLAPLKMAVGCPKRKLLILDVNGLLADIVPYVSDGYTPDTWISMKAVFKRPFCDDFLKFCFERFDVGFWSSRTRRNVERVVDFLMGDTRRKLLFCWNQYHCTETGYKTLQNRSKPLVLKEIRKLWNKEEADLPWEKGDYDESNTLLLDDSPYKALCNPPYTAIFPYPYEYKDVRDNSLGPGGRLQVYLENLASADNVQKFVKENPCGQRAITKSNLNWPFYSKIINDGVIRAEKKYLDGLIEGRKENDVIINLSSRQEETKNEEAACSRATHGLHQKVV